MRLLADGPGMTSPAPGTEGVGAAAPPDRLRTWTAKFEWRDTPDGACFAVIARADDDDAGEVTIAHSQPLDWPPAGPASVQALTDAVQTLEAALLAAGWQPLPQGSEWYAKRFIGAPSAGSPAPVEVGRKAAKATKVDAPLTRSFRGSPSAQAASRPGDLHPPREGENGGGARDETAARAPRPPEDPWGIARETSERPVARRAVLVATVGQLVLAAAVTGVLLGRAFVAGDGAPAVPQAAASSTIAHGGLRLQVPGDWARGQAAAVPGFSRPLRLKNTRERLTALVERLPASSASLLPVTFDDGRPSVGDGREVVSLSAGQLAWRYRRGRPDGSATLLYAAPTTSGVATVACVAQSGAGVPPGCETLAKAITVPGAVPLELGASAAFYTRLPAAAKALEAARSTLMRDLAAATSASGQAAAADGLVRAHERALAALAPLTGTRAHLPSATVRALSTMAGAYATLAGAARARSSRRYNAARRAVARADADLRRTLAKAAAAATAASHAPTDAGRRVP